MFHSQPFVFTPPPGPAMTIQQPKWKALTGMKRIQAEFKYMQKEISAGRMPCVSNLTILADDACTWRFRLSNFDNARPGGKNLNDELNRMNSM